MIGNAIAGIYGIGVTPVLTAYQSISTVTVGSGGVGSVTFSSIPSTYTHLQIRYTARSGLSNSGLGTNIYLQFNGDSGSNYSIHQLRANGSGIFPAGGGSQTSIYAGISVADAAATTGVFGVGVYDILDYASTNKYKTTRLLNGFDNNGTGVVDLSSGAWLSTSAVNSLTLFPDSSFAQYSQFALYGIKGA